MGRCPLPVDRSRPYETTRFVYDHERGSTSSGRVRPVRRQHPPRSGSTCPSRRARTCRWPPTPTRPASSTIPPNLPTARSYAPLTDRTRSLPVTSANRTIRGPTRRSTTCSARSEACSSPAVSRPTTPSRRAFTRRRTRLQSTRPFETSSAGSSTTAPANGPLCLERFVPTKTSSENILTAEP